MRKNLAESCDPRREFRLGRRKRSSGGPMLSIRGPPLFVAIRMEEQRYTNPPFVTVNRPRNRAAFLFLYFLSRFLWDALCLRVFARSSVIRIYSLNKTFQCEFFTRIIHWVIPEEEIVLYILYA